MKFELTQMKKLPFVFLVAFTLLVSLTVQAQNEKETYPKITGFVGIIHPLVTLTSSDITTNFKDYYTVGMPIGINIWKNDKIGFSFEIVPTIKSDSEISKVNNILIHPGVLVRLKKGYTFTGRIAFETSGRYGFTPVLTKIIKKYSDHNYYISVPMPVRFGNNHDSSLTIGLQVGIGF
jgi:hypothetical protein